MIIKKLNTMFHKHSRVLFGAFTLIIIVAFMDFLTPGKMGCDGMGADGSVVGRAYGKKVSIDDLQELNRRFSLYLEVFEGQRVDLEAEQLFSLFCRCAKAERDGLLVSDLEVADFIRTYPAFFTDGKFDQKKYRQLVANLNRRGIGDDDLVEAVRLRLLLLKQSNLLASRVVVTPSEVETLYRTGNTKFQIAAAAYTADSVVAKPTKAQLEAFFKANQARYRIPRRLAALVVEIPHGDFIAAAQKGVTEARVERFYNNNKSLFADKNGKERPFAEVRREVRKRLLEVETAELAKRKAYDFASAIYENMNIPAERREAAFAAAVKKAGLRLHPLAWVASGDAAVGKIKSPELVRALFAAADSNPVTDAVELPGSIVVGCMIRHTPARDAAFAEIPAARLEKEWRITEARKVAAADADKLNKIADAKARYKAFRELKHVKFTDFAFTQVGNPAPPAGMESVLALAVAADGSVTAVPAESGSTVYFLRGRELPAAAGFAAAKGTSEFMCRIMKQQLAQFEFEEELNRNCQFLMKREGQR
ncbi:MAG: SurA N-terminal domain-containing protein [Lentisphaeria bacterium]|nr:SurA N-terminal domain-containing protein [Lentisphaeria bacterium]